jgi:hypothetical protein
MKSQLAVGAATVLLGVFTTAATSSAFTCTANLTTIHADTTALQVDAAKLSTDTKAQAQAQVTFKVAPTPANQAALTLATAKVATDNTNLAVAKAKLNHDAAMVPIVCS